MDASHGHLRYLPARDFALPDRTWPDRQLTAAPRWLSTDLRDGNQALAAPMDPTRRLLLFQRLVAVGYKEIEVGFPAAGRDEHDFVRELIERDLIPADVRISVLVQARDELIRRTVECLRGAPAAIVHLYNATAPRLRDLVLRSTRAEVKALAVEGTRLIMKYAGRLLGDCDFGYQYSPELFHETEPDFALEGAAQAGAGARDLPGDMPYLPLDPREAGRDDTAVVRITSQPGKGGVGFVLEAGHGLNPPRDRCATARAERCATERGIR